VAAVGEAKLAFLWRESTGVPSHAVRSHRTLSVLRVEREQLERVPPVGAGRVGVDELLALRDVLDGLRAGHDVALDRRREEQAVPPDDR